MENECRWKEYSNLTWSQNDGRYIADCYHVIYIEAYQWGWNFDCLTLVSQISVRSWNSNRGWNTCGKSSLKQGEVYLAVMGSADVTHAPWFVSWGVKEDVLYSQGAVDRNGDGLSDNLMLTQDGQYDFQRLWDN